MAEFGAVMHDWSRMCKHFWSGDPTVKCSKDCPLNEIWCPCMNEPVMDAGKFDAEKLESVVTEWAAEHPEPVYPTWREWLLQQGVIRAGTETRNGFTYQTVADKLFDPIDAKTAEKLGIPPVEVTK